MVTKELGALPEVPIKRFPNIMLADAVRQTRIVCAKTGRASVLATVRTNYGTGDQRQEQANGNFRPGDIRLHAWFCLLIKLGSILAAMMVATMGSLSDESRFRGMRRSCV